MSIYFVIGKMQINTKMKYDYHILTQVATGSLTMGNRWG